MGNRQMGLPFTFTQINEFIYQKYFEVKLSIFIEKLYKSFVNKVSSQSI